MQFMLQLVAPQELEQEGHEASVPEGFGHVVQSFQAILNSLEPEDLENIATAIDRGLSPRIEPQDRQLAARFVGRDFDRSERLELEIEATIQGFRLRRELLEGALATEKVAELLGTSRQTPHDRVSARTLLAVLDRGTLRFPTWQFDPAGSNGVVPGFAEVLRALPVAALPAVAWFVRTNPYLEDRTPIAALKDGDCERVVTAARGVGAS